MRRLLFVGFLAYVALDLSLPAMPGAFVFDPTGSVEGTDVSRVRPMAKTMVLPTLAKHSFELVTRRHHEVRGGPRRSADIAHPARALATCLPRATCASPPPSEDPH
jgi:hypothetical protein